MSEREGIARRLAAIVSDMGLTQPYGGDVDKFQTIRGVSHYNVAFALPRILDGNISVYGPRWILVTSQGYKSISVVCKSEMEAAQLLRDNFSPPGGTSWNHHQSAQAV